MRRIDGTSRNNGRPPGVVDALQVREHSVEPILSNRCANLLSHPGGRTACFDEAELLRPEVSLVFLSFAFPRDGEGLAGT